MLHNWQDPANSLCLCDKLSFLAPFFEIMQRIELVMKENSCLPWKQTTSQEIFNPSLSFPFTRAMTFRMWLNRQYGVHTASDFFTRQSNLSKRRVLPWVTDVEEICYNVWHCPVWQKFTYISAQPHVSVFVWKNSAAGNNALLKCWLQGVAPSRTTEFFIFVTVKPQIFKASVHSVSRRSIVGSNSSKVVDVCLDRQPSLNCRSGHAGLKSTFPKQYCCLLFS
jgi:hypothetical protein